MSSLSANVPLDVGNNKGRRRHRWLAVLLWVIFGAGLLVQSYGPHVKITNNTFVIPPSLVSGGKDIHPAEIIAYERSKHLVSGILTVGGALGIALYYRNLLVSSLLSLFQRHQGAPAPLPLNSRDSRAEQEKEENQKEQNDTS
jgi:hypothetical protein